MTALTWLALGNLLLAIPLAGLAWLSGRYLRRPALTHGLWLLVLLKLVTPPLGVVPIGSFDARAPLPEEAPATVVAEQPLPIDDALAPDEWAPLEFAEIVPVETLRPTSVEPVVAEFAVSHGVVSIEPPKWRSWTPWIVPTLGSAWLFGAVVFWIRGARKCLAFERLLKSAAVGDVALQARVARLSDELNVPAPRTALTAGTLSPLLWVWGRTATLVLPRTLFEQLSPEQQTTLLVHELAHWKRGDHWVRRLECVAGGLYWWCPLVWWALAEIRQAEEELCDAWVVATVPGSARDYALALVETVDFLAGSSPTKKLALPPLASGLGPFPSLQRRLTMIFRTGTPRRLTFAGFAGLTLLGGLLLTWTPAPSVAQDDPPMRKKKDKDFNPRGGGDDVDARLQELNRAMEKLRAEADKLRAQREKKDDAPPPRRGDDQRGGDQRGGDQDPQRQIEELQKMRDRLKARLAELEKQGDDNEEAKRIREKLRDRVIEMKKDFGPADGDLQKLRQELEAKKGELEKLARELQRKAQEIEEMGRKIGEKGDKFRFEFKFPQNFGPPNWARKPGGGGGGDAKPDERPNPTPRPDPAPRAGGDMERRMDEMERKLDMLIRRLEGGQGGPPRRGPGGQGGPGGPGGDGPPRKDGKEKASFEIELGGDRGPGGRVVIRRDDGFAPAPVAPQRVD